MAGMSRRRRLYRRCQTGCTCSAGKDHPILGRLLGMLLRSPLVHLRVRRSSRATACALHRLLHTTCPHHSRRISSSSSSSSSRQMATTAGSGYPLYLPLTRSARPHLLQRLYSTGRDRAAWGSTVGGGAMRPEGPRTATLGRSQVAHCQEVLSRLRGREQGVWGRVR